MAFRPVRPLLRLLAGPSEPSAIGLLRQSTKAPTVFDRLVQITVVDQKGHRHEMLGREGQKLSDVLYDNADRLGGEEEVMCLSPEGIGKVEAHVTIPNELLQKVPAPQGPDQRALEEIAPNIFTNSRLASKVVLSKDMNGMSVALAETYPWKTL